MKSFNISVLLICLFSFSFGQTTKIAVYCKISPSIGGFVLDYCGAEKYLPDSSKADVLIDYKKKYSLRNKDTDNALLLMGVDGWRLSSSYYDHTSGHLIYILNKEIYLDGPAIQSYLDKLKNAR